MSRISFKRRLESKIRSLKIKMKKLRKRMKL